MTSYQWSSALFESVYALGHPPKWFPFPLDGGPVLAVSTQSPLGEGSYLERVEFFMTGSATLVGSIDDPTMAQLADVSVIALGEVYATGEAGLPDPRTGTNVPGALRAAANMRVSISPSTTTFAAVGSFSTDGYVTSHAVRGPAKYGGGTPELRVAVYSPNQYTSDTIGAMDSSECYSLYALWRV